MAALIAGMASSHAYTFYTPDQWDARFQRSRANYVRINGQEPPANPLRETDLAGDAARFAPIRQGLDKLKVEFDALAPDVLMILGDDQGENYVANTPQFAIYAGERVVSFDSESGQTQTYACDAELARALAEHLVEHEDIDLTVTSAFPDDRLNTHAHAQILNFLRPSVPVLLVFINAVCMPAPTPRRCHQFGQALARAIQQTGRPGRILAYASGGLSHFSSDYPIKAYGGPLRMGDICEGFDAQVIDWLERGEGEQLAGLSARDLIENGALEHRQWIALAGMMGARAPEWFVHGAFHRAIMNMGVAYWRLSA